MEKWKVTSFMGEKRGVQLWNGIFLKKTLNRREIFVGKKTKYVWINDGELSMHWWMILMLSAIGFFSRFHSEVPLLAYSWSIKGVEVWSESALSACSIFLNAFGFFCTRIIEKQSSAFVVLETRSLKYKKQKWVIHIFRVDLIRRVRDFLPRARKKVLKFLQLSILNVLHLPLSISSSQLVR